MVEAVLLLLGNSGGADPRCHSRGLTGPFSALTAPLHECRIDFILVLLAEEWGLLGSLAVLFAFCIVIFYGYVVALHTQYVFGRLLAMGLTTSFFLYVFVNMAIVTGLIPVVGIPLPLLSNGGTVMMAVMISAGLLLSISLRPTLNRGSGRALGDRAGDDPIMCRISRRSRE